MQRSFKKKSTGAIETSNKRDLGHELFLEIKINTS